MTSEEFTLSAPYWVQRSYRKGDFYNEHRSVCKHLGFVLNGAFRSYIIDEKTADEKNVFLYSGNQFVVSFKSFIRQIPCDYHTQAMTDATILSIGFFDLMSLYQKSHAWERFGRLLAQEAFNVAMERTESFLFKSPEERYLDLVNQHPDIFNTVPLYHISSYLGIQGPSLSRIRKRISGK
ncbi:MAG: Crp/Fnr family transcriptional regulator [Bacteroidetes bacterium]|nr:Crp/Fnr family transcriptional regulator [Bacteroidota bacterium]